MVWVIDAARMRICNPTALSVMLLLAEIGDDTELKFTSRFNLLSSFELLLMPSAIFSRVFVCPLLLFPAFVFYKFIDRSQTCP